MIVKTLARGFLLGLFLFSSALLNSSNAQDSTLVAFYPFNGNAYDTSGFDNHGVVYGAELTSDRFGGMDSAYYFTGDSSYIEVDYDSSFSLRSGFTFSVWAKGTSSTFDLAGLIAVGRGYPFFLGIDEGDRLFLRAAASDTTKAEVTVTTTTDPLEWNHYVGTYKPSEFIRIYKNGVLAGENTVDVPDSLQSFDKSIFIGRRDDSSISSKFYHFNGSMDDIRIYNYAINDSAVQVLYAEGGWPEAEFPTKISKDSLVAYYTFDGDATDMSGYENDGTIYGATLTEDRFGNEDQSFYFDGNSYIDFGLSDITEFGENDFSLSVWVKPGAGSNEQYQILRKGNDNLQEGESRWVLGTTNDWRLRLIFEDAQGDSSLVLYGEHSLKADKWQNLTITFDRDSLLTAYVDNVPELVTDRIKYYSGDMNNGDTYHLFAGRPNSDASSLFYVGAMDDIRIYKRALTESDVNTIYHEGGWPDTEYTGEVLPDTLLAYYPFSGNAEDESGFQNDGQINGSELTFDRFGNPGSAYQFDGVNDYIKLASDFDFPERSVSIWFNLKDIEGYQRIYYSDHPDLEHSSTNIDVSKNDQTGQIQLRLEAGGGQAEDILAPIELDTWYHALITVDSTTTTAYLNGELIGSAPFVNHHSSAGIPHAFLGTNSDTVRYFFNGSLDDIRIYNYVINDSLITELYAEGGWPETKYLPDTLLAYYPFSGNANDQSGFGNKSTVHGPELTFDRFGNPNSAYDFDGSDDYINTNATFDYPNRTTSFWFKARPSKHSGYNIILVQDSDELENGAFLALLDERKLVLQDGLGESIYQEENLEFEKWYHAVIVRDDILAKYYLNNDFLGSKPVDFVGSSSFPELNLIIGTSRVKDRDFFNGLIDDIRIYNYALDDSAIAGLYYENGWPETADTTRIPSDTLLAHYPFNGDSLDHSGYENHPIVHGAVPSEDRFGWADSAYAFDGVDDYMIIPSPDSLHTQKNLSFSFWAKGEANEDSFTGFVSKPNMSPFGVGMDDQNRLIFSITSGKVPLNLVVEENVPDLGKWHHYLAVFRAGEYLRLYVDGEEAGSLYGTIPNYINTDNADIWLGATQFDSANTDTVFFKGSIDEVRFYNYDLDDEEVLDIYVNESTVPTDNEVLEIIPDNYELYQNYPNPFNPSTTVKFDLPAAGNVSLKVYDITGRLVSTLIDGYRTAGSHSVILNASGLSSGVYLYQIRTSEYSAVRKFTLIK